MERSLFALGGVAVLFGVSCIAFVCMIAGGFTSFGPAAGEQEKVFRVTNAQHIDVSDNDAEMAKSDDQEISPEDSDELAAVGENDDLESETTEFEGGGDVELAGADRANAHSESRRGFERSADDLDSFDGELTDFSSDEFGSEDDAGFNSGEMSLSDQSLDPAVLTVNDIPSHDEAAALADRWIGKLADAVADDRLGRLHEQMSSEYQRRTTLRTFKRMFSEFVRGNAQIPDFMGLPLTWRRSPSIDGDGLLQLEGYYPSEPELGFRLALKREAQGWAPDFIRISVNDNNRTFALPSADEIKRQVIRATHEFGQSVKFREFGMFYRNTYSKFQEKFTLQQFRDYFRDFVVNEADLSWLKGIEPVFDQPPTINSNGFLQVEGYFPAEPVVRFRYAFIEEDYVWKVSTINLSIPAKEDNRYGAENVSADDNEFQPVTVQ